MDRKTIIEKLKIYKRKSEYSDKIKELVYLVLMQRETTQLKAMLIYS